MTICVESMFSLPESWNANGTQYTYAACLPMPVSDEVRTLKKKDGHFFMIYYQTKLRRTLLIKIPKSHCKEAI